MRREQVHPPGYSDGRYKRVAGCALGKDFREVGLPELQVTGEGFQMVGHWIRRVALGTVDAEMPKCL